MTPSTVLEAARAQWLSRTPTQKTVMRYMMVAIVLNRLLNACIAVA